MDVGYFQRRTHTTVNHGRHPMEKRYQVFVSSTYADLKEERGRVIQTLMEMDCIPAGMELFPAMDEAQLEFIKRVIIGGRYGTMTAQGISYTEQEYDYAVSRGLKVMAFLHEVPDELPVAKSELDAEARVKLSAFREKVATGRLVKFWRKAEELPALVAMSLTRTMKTYPAEGWIRGAEAPTKELLAEMNELRKRNAELLAKVTHFHTEEAKAEKLNLAPLDATVHVGGKVMRQQATRLWTVQTTWSTIFALIAPLLMQHPHDVVVQHSLAKYLYQLTAEPGSNPSLDDHDLPGFFGPVITGKSLPGGPPGSLRSFAACSA
jgi:hypothetical protein